MTDIKVSKDKYTSWGFDSENLIYDRGNTIKKRAKKDGDRAK